MLGILMALSLSSTTAHAYDPFGGIDWGWWLDLELPDLVCSGSWQAEESQTTVTILVENVGDAPSPMVWLDVYSSDIRSDHDDIDIGDAGFEFVRVKPLPPGGTLEYTFSYPSDLLTQVVVTQDYPFLYNACQIDSFGQALEWNESNNITTWSDQIYPELIP